MKASVTRAATARVSGSRAQYDDLPEAAQAKVRVEWDRRMAATLAELDFTRDLAAAGKPWAEADEAGVVVIRHPAPPAD